MTRKGTIEGNQIEIGEKLAQYPVELQKLEVSDTTDVDSSNIAYYKIIT
jgi:hypothetical protein